MSDCEKAPLFKFHSVSPVKCTLLEEQKNMKPYLNKLIACNICIIINILIILLTLISIGFLEPLNISILITIVITHVFLFYLTGVKHILTCRFLIISKKFKTQIFKICGIFIILIMIEVFLLILFYGIISDIEISILLLSSVISLVFAGIIIMIEIAYIIV